MRKLSKLKQWLTIGDAAQHLSIVFGETVNEADVLRLGLDGHLKLSVHFVNHTEARVGNAIPIAEAKTALSVFRTEGEEPHHIVLGIVLNDREVLNLAEDIITLDGVWDLSMIGNESLDVEHAYQNLTGGPAVTLTCLDGAFVQREDGKIFQLQSRFDEEHYKKDSKLPWGHPSFYYPAGGLPKDSVLVVRMTALAEFEKNLSLDSREKPLMTRERDNLLSLIAVLATLNYGKDEMEKPHALAKQIVQDATNKGLELSIAERALGDKLKEAATFVETKAKK